MIILVVCNNLIAILYQITYLNLDGQIMHGIIMAKGDILIYTLQVVKAQPYFGI